MLRIVAVILVSMVFCTSSPVSGQGEPTPPVIAGAAKSLVEAVENGEAVGVSHLVVREGRVIHFASAGVCDIEDDRPFARDTIVRIYSMTKPITTFAAMQLYEQGKFQLDDPVSKFIPAFADAVVLQQDEDVYTPMPCGRPMTVRDVMRHTTGYGYGDSGNAAHDKAYRDAGVVYHPPEEMYPPRMTIEQAALLFAKIPTHHHPGERFTYGFSTDLLGRLIEVWSGQSLDEYFRDSIFQPLEMNDTAFVVPRENLARFASCHKRIDGRWKIVDKSANSGFVRGFEFLSGGGGLVSTIDDYANFCQVLVDGGTFNGKQVISKPSIDLMFAEHYGDDDGFRFGLGFAISQVAIGPPATRVKAPQYVWGGYASTDFRIVPDEKLVQVVFRQCVPTSPDLATRLIEVVNNQITPLDAASD